MHAGTVITNEGLGHESGRLAVGVGDVVYAVLQNLYFVSLGDEGVEAYANLTLTGGADFVVVYFNLEAHLLHG